MISSNLLHVLWWSAHLAPSFLTPYAGPINAKDLPSPFTGTVSVRPFVDQLDVRDSSKDAKDYTREGPVPFRSVKEESEQSELYAPTISRDPDLKHVEMTSRWHVHCDTIGTLLHIMDFGAQHRQGYEVLLVPYRGVHHFVEQSYNPYTGDFRAVIEGTFCKEVKKMSCVYKFKAHIEGTVEWRGISMDLIQSDIWGRRNPTVTEHCTPHEGTCSVSPGKKCTIVQIDVSEL